MAAPIRLRPDFDAARLRALAKHSRDPDQTRRLLALVLASALSSGKPWSASWKKGRSLPFTRWCAGA